MSARGWMIVLRPPRLAVFKATQLATCGALEEVWVKHSSTLEKNQLYRAVKQLVLKWVAPLLAVSSASQHSPTNA